MSAYTGLSPQGETMMRTVFFDHPRWTPVTVGFLPACRAQYGERLDEVLLEHPRLFPQFKREETPGPVVYQELYIEGERSDCWGCVWGNLHGGMVGQVTGHPLSNWEAFDSWQPPDPLRDGLLEPRDWEAIARNIRHKKEHGFFSPDGVIAHGFHYMLLCDLRGFENVMMDMAMGEPRLDRLIDVILDYNATVTQKVLDMGSVFYGLAEDLGMQHALPVSLDLWRKYVKPGYEATAGQARDRDIPVFLHSDGHILPIIDDLYETGIRMLNPQIRANGLDGLREKARGKLAICLDLDRQLFPFATPEQLKAHVREAHDALYLPEGGLMLSIEIGHDVPIENMHALFSAVEEVCRLPEPGDTGHCSVGW